MSVSDLRTSSALSLADPMGMKWRGNWNALTTYLQNDVVLAANAEAYICIVAQGSVAQNPLMNPAVWTRLSTPGVPSAGYYGSFYDTTTQLMSTAAPYTAFTLNTTAEASGVSIVGGSQVTLANTGVYDIQFSAQVVGGANETIAIWLRVNGMDEPQSNTTITLKNNENYVAAWNFVRSFNAGDHFELIGYSPSGNTDIEVVVGLPGPAVPSLILTVVQV